MILDLVPYHSGRRIESIRQVVNIVIPELRDEHKDFPKGGFDDYLIQIGLVTVRACKR